MDISHGYTSLDLVLYYNMWVLYLANKKWILINAERLYDLISVEVYKSKTLRVEKNNNFEMFTYLSNITISILKISNSKNRNKKHEMPSKNKLRQLHRENITLIELISKSNMNVSFP